MLGTFSDIVDSQCVTLPSGEYIVGDLCHFLPEAIYNPVVVSGGVGARIVTFEYDKQHVALYMFYDYTALGDGEYNDENGNVYYVDAGIIGCLRVSDLPTSLRNEMVLRAEDCAHLVTMKSTFKPCCDTGVFSIGHISINTYHIFDDSDDDDGFVDYEDDANNWDDFEDWDTR